MNERKPGLHNPQSNGGGSGAISTAAAVSTIGVGLVEDMRPTGEKIPRV